jgi:hypothetical protein
MEGSGVLANCEPPPPPPGQNMRKRQSFILFYFGLFYLIYFVLCISFYFGRVCQVLPVSREAATPRLRALQRVGHLRVVVGAHSRQDLLPAVLANEPDHRGVPRRGPIRAGVRCHKVVP